MRHCMQIKSRRTLLLAGTMLLPFFTSAAILLDLDFDHNAGTWGRTTDSYGTTVLETDVEDSNNYFGLGVTNLHARWADASGLNPRSASTAFAPASGLSLKLTVDLQVQSYNAPYKALIGFFSGSDLTTHPTDNLRVAGANLQNLATQRLYQLALYYNGAAETLTVYNPTTGLAQSLEQYQSAAFAYDEAADVWHDISMNSSHSTGAIERIGLYNNAGRDARSNIIFDNLKVVAVPELANSVAYITAASALLLLVRSRTKRQAAQ